MSVPTLADLKAHTNISSSVNDDELVEMLDAALDVVRDIVGPVGAAPVTETHYGVSSVQLVLRQVPASSITSITYSWFGGTAQTVTSSSYVLDPETGIVRMVSGSPFCGDVTATYTAGSDDMPAAVRLATLVIAAHLWETQRGAAPISTITARDAEVIQMTGSRFAIPDRAKELLDPYVRTPVVG